MEALLNIADAINLTPFYDIAFETSPPQLGVTFVATPTPANSQNQFVARNPKARQTTIQTGQGSPASPTPAKMKTSSATPLTNHYVL